ncbi:hypothetical protein PITC_081690 [Penicillium italicum]|uniref:NAD(P)-binding domain-containing protein n=1 Tax=Penicillium italicum TaxID=40296 RepID=A0A0A2L648_PENIT|nr:hypothetical protein PITC_081690 [Penicillium italicum]
MKLIIADATGLLATEIVRQSLQIREITQVVALAHKPLQLDKSIGSPKVKSVVIRDYGEYPDDVKAEFTGADACIWNVAATPLHTGDLEFAEIKRVCQDCTKLGFEAMCEAGPARPFRFIYLSVEGTPQDPTKKPAIMADYHIMRRNTELMILKFPAEKEGVEVCIARPGLIANSTTWSRALVANLFRIVSRFGRALPTIQRSELAAALLNQVMDGFEKETLLNADLVRLGRRELKFRTIKMVNRSESKNPNPEHKPNDAPEMKDPVQPGSSDMDERMTRDYKEAIDKSNIVNEERLRRIIPQSTTAYREPSEEEIDISWRPDPSGHPGRTF